MITPKDFVFLSGFKGLSCWFFGMEIKQKLRRSEKQPKKKNDTHTLHTHNR